MAKHPFKRTSPLMPITTKDSYGEPQKMIKIADAVGFIQNVYQQQMANRKPSGLFNPMSGAGGATDKSSFFTFIPYWLNDTSYIERVCNQSWVAERFVNMPIDDMFAKPRTYNDEKFEKEFKRLKIDDKIASAMKLARKYGTGLFWLVTQEAPPDTPLNPSRILAGDVVNCIALDRTDATILRKDTNILSPTFNEPSIYNIRIHGRGSVDVHASRIYRIDGQRADSINGWRAYEKNWGVSSLIKVMTDVFNDVSVVEAISQLMQEASIPVHKIAGLNDIQSRGESLPDEVSVDEMMQYTSVYKSIYRTMFLDGEDDFDRTSVNFSNIPDLMDRFEERLAMASGMSVTRFLGKAPSGLNATGEGDQRNDSKTIRIRQAQMLEPFYQWIDPLVSRSVGTPSPAYLFPALFEMSDKELTEVELNRARTAKIMTDAFTWTPEEAKEYMATGVTPKDKGVPEKPKLQEKVLTTA